MLKKMCIAAALSLSLTAGGKAYADNVNYANKSGKSLPVEISQRFELTDKLNLRLFSSEGLNLLAAKDGRMVQERLGGDLELKLDGKLSKMIPYARGEVDTVGYELGLPFPWADGRRDLSVGGGAGIKFRLYEKSYEGKKMEIALDAHCSYGSLFKEYCGGGVEIRW